MNIHVLRTTGGVAFLVSLLAWIYGGAQIGLYKTYYTIQKTDEITGLTYEEKVDAFLPGIETLALGFAVFATLILASSVLESRQAGK